MNEISYAYLLCQATLNHGYGNGYGNGNGNGNGNGYGNGNGIKLHSFRNDQVYYVDGIPCTFISVASTTAKVNVIDIESFETSVQYIYKFNGFFAHGLTKEKAKQDAERKYYSTLDVDSSIDLFNKSFKSGIEYASKDFYNWHTILTGSCDSGKDMWMRDRGIDINSMMTREMFVELTKDAYGSDVIRRLDDH